MLAGLVAPKERMALPHVRRRLDNSQWVANVFAHFLIVKRAKGGSANKCRRQAGLGPSQGERRGPGRAPDRRRARGLGEGGAGRSAALEPRQLRAAAAAPRPDQATRTPGKDPRSRAR